MVSAPRWRILKILKRWRPVGLACLAAQRLAGKSLAGGRCWARAAHKTSWLGRTNAMSQLRASKLSCSRALSLHITRDPSPSLSFRPFCVLYFFWAHTRYPGNDCEDDGVYAYGQLDRVSGSRLELVPCALPCEPCSLSPAKRITPLAPSRCTAIYQDQDSRNKPANRKQPLL